MKTQVSTLTKTNSLLREKLEKLQAARAIEKQQNKAIQDKTKTNHARKQVGEKMHLQ